MSGLKLIKIRGNLDDVPENIFERLETYKNQGAVGIGELMINRSIDDPMIQEIFAAAETLSLPVLFHMSPEVGYEYGIVTFPSGSISHESGSRI